MNTNLRFLDSQLNRIDLFTISPNGEQIAVSGVDQKIRYRIVIHDSRTCARIVNSLSHDSQLLSMQYSPCSKYLLCGGYHGVAFWNMQIQKQTNKINIASLHQARYSRDGTCIIVISSSFLANVSIMNICRTNYQKHGLKKSFHQKSSFACIDVAVQYIIFGNLKGKIVIWNCNTNKQFSKVIHHLVINVKIQQDEQTFYSVNKCLVLYIWDIQLSQKITKVYPQCGFINLRSIDFSPDGQLLIYTALDIIQMWQINRDYIENIYSKNSPGNINHILPIQFSPDMAFSVIVDDQSSVWTVKYLI